MNKVCEMCGTPLNNVHGLRRFCLECGIKREKLRAKSRYQESKKGGPRLCRFCGAETDGDLRKRCPSCTTKNKERRGEGYINKPKPEVAKPERIRNKPLKGCWDLSHKSVTQVEVEATALGLSYGRYTSLIDSLFIERYLASEGITDGLERIDRAWKQFKKDKRDFERRLAARIEEEERNEQELMEIEMGCFGEASVHTDNTLHSYY